MSQFLFHYVRLEPPTWVFLSTLLVIGLFLMFHRFWSLRNLDILLVLAFTPGMMLVYEGRQKAFRNATPEVVSLQNGQESAPPNSELATEVAKVDLSWPQEKFQYWGFVWLLICASLTVTRMLLDTTIVRRPLLDPNLSSGGMLFLGTSLLIYLMVNVATSSPVEQRRSSPEIGPGYVLLSALPQISTTPQMPVSVGDSSTHLAATCRSIWPECWPLEPI